MSSRATTIFIQVLSMVIFALISAAVPQYLPLIFVVYFAILLIVSSRLATRGMKKASSVKGTPLFREDNPAQVAVQDDLLLQEVKDQFKSTLVLMFLPFILVVVLAQVYWMYINQIIESYVLQGISDSFLSRFIQVLIFYAFISAVMLIPRWLMSRRFSQKKQLMIPQKFMVYKDGIVMDGRLVSYANDMCFKLDTRRKYTELHSAKLPFTVRLYTLEVSKLAEKLREVGLRECRE